jgi:hypothetical protein
MFSSCLFVWLSVIRCDLAFDYSIPNLSRRVQQPRIVIRDNGAVIYNFFYSD